MPVGHNKIYYILFIINKQENILYKFLSPGFPGGGSGCTLQSNSHIKIINKKNEFTLLFNSVYFAHCLIF